MTFVLRRAVLASAAMGGCSVTYLLRDEFTDTLAAGLVNGTSATPGPGTRTVVDMDGDALSIGSGVASFANPNNMYGNPGLWYDACTRTTGIAVLACHQPSPVMFMRIGWAAAQSGTPQAGVFLYQASGTFRVLDDVSAGPELDSYELVAQTLAVIMRAVGHFFVLNSTLVWVGNYATTATVYPVATPYSTSAMVQWMRVAQLPAPWTDDYGIATQCLAGARSAGDMFIHEANALIEATVATLPSDGQIELRFRVQDATNYWQVTVDATGALDLDEVVDGSVTQRGTSAGVIVNGEIGRAHV